MKEFTLAVSHSRKRTVFIAGKLIFNFRVMSFGLAIFSIPMFVVGCSSRSIMMDVYSPQELRDQSVVIPSQGISITSPLHLAGNVEILGGGKIILKGEGRVVVEKNSKVSLRNVFIEASEIITVESEKSVYLVTVKPGRNTSLVIDDSKFVVDIAYENSGLEAPWDQPPKIWVVGIPDVDVDPTHAMKLVIRNSNFINEQPYAAGALELLQTASADFLPTLKGEIEGSEFYGFHGVIRANNLQGFTVSGNRLVKNSFANIFVHGDDVTVKSNKIYFPGNGTTGDGITALGKLTDSVIDNNTIFVGSCYGILVRGREVSDLKVVNNTIINGITTAVLVAGAENKAKDVSVTNNMISGNYGFAVAFSGVESSKIEGNYFSNNAIGYPSQVYIESSPNVVLKYNLVAPSLTPEWTKGLKLYRSHVQIDDSSFTLPRIKKVGSTENE